MPSDTKAPYRTTYRDRLVYRVCSWVIDHVATPEYKAFITATTSFGKVALDEYLALSDPEEQ